MDRVGQAPADQRIDLPPLISLGPLVLPSLALSSGRPANVGVIKSYGPVARCWDFVDPPGPGPASTYSCLSSDYLLRAIMASGAPAISLANPNSPALCLRRQRVLAFSRQQLGLVFWLISTTAIGYAGPLKMGNDWSVVTPEVARIDVKPLAAPIEWLDGLHAANIHSVVCCDVVP